MKHISSYTLFNESSNSNYGIHDWIEDLKSWEWSRPTHQPVNESSIKKWSDHFIGQGYFEKVKDLVDRIFLSFNKVDVEEINDRMYDVYDQIPSSKDNWVMCCVVYGDVEKWGKPNKHKYNGLITVAKRDARDRQRIMTAILKDIVYPTLYIGSYPNMMLRQSDESYYVTDPKWKCANFNIDDYQEMGISAGAEFETDDFKGRKTVITDFDIQKKKEYSIDKFFDMYKPAVVIEIGNRDHSIAKGGMNLIKLESMIDETLESILPTLDYQEVLWDKARFDRKFDEDTDVYDYTVKILLNLK